MNSVYKRLLLTNYYCVESNIIVQPLWTYGYCNLLQGQAVMISYFLGGKPGVTLVLEVSFILFLPSIHFL